MNETQQLIKSEIEKKMKQEWDIDVVVEYVSDVNKRQSEIVNQYQEMFSSVYEANKLTGVFIPAIGQNPYYILVQEDRNEMLDVMTAFHEYRHLTDYVEFLQTVFGNDIKKMRSSQLYLTFNVYSEFSATRNGVLKYLDIVTITGMTQKEVCEKILQFAKTQYKNMDKIRNRYQLLVHSLQYLGYVIACISYIENINLKQIIDDMELSNELKPIIFHILQFENKYDWYETSDRLMRKFVNG